ncbi:MAG: FkbM family methyltransferase [Bacteroidia bacterium]
MGAYNRDSAVYFALRGAKKVVALEPSSTIFLWVQRNIQNLGLEDRITLICAGLGKEDGFMDMYFRPGQFLTESVLYRGDPTNNIHEKVQVLSLSTLLDKIGWEEVDVMKLDCEGCEKEVLMEEGREALGRVRSFVMEYHFPPKR